MSTSDQSLWDNEFIKNAMEKIAREERPMRPFMESTSSSNVNMWGKPSFYVQKVNSVVEEKEEIKKEAQFFDPKELDIDDVK